MHQLFARLIAKARPTVVFVSHLTDDAARLADRVILIDHRPARIVADIDLPTPQGERNEAVLADYRKMLDAYFGRPQ
jgi:NitT/TauT family transport system ATP-binding protein/sulfonate transport system ATP-binding protein